MFQRLRLYLNESQPTKGTIMTEQQQNSRRKRFLRRPEVRARYGDVSTAALYLWMKQGLFPRPIRIGPRMVAWDEETLDAHDERLRSRK